MKTWDIKKTLYKTADFLTWQKQKALELSPHFQRRSVWKSGAKSYLIDTIIRGLPVPIIFIREKRSNLKTFEPKREIVDGQQRLRTVISFIAPNILKDFNESTDEFVINKAHSKEYGGFSFKRLPEEIQQRILDYEFSVHILPAEVGDRDVLEIFSRMNATGVKLNDQELRNAEWYGEFKSIAYELATEQLQRWRDWGIFSESAISRMEEVELTGELLMLIRDGIRGKSQEAIDKYYQDYDQSLPNKNVMEVRFRYVMDIVDSTLGQIIKETEFKKKALFYPLFATVYDKCYDLNSKLQNKKPNPLATSFGAALKKANQKILNATAPQAVLESLARRTTHPESRTKLVKYLNSF
ncbi:MAG: hypothetical protein JWO30_4994 [Fibrobacteres bacterium]|nr:hypothetical protein [Fibrobacterota bacterium]